MLATTHTATVVGIEAHPVQVEVEIARGMPSFDLVGLPEATVRESRIRVRSAFEQLQLTFPVKRVTVNLAPADVRKHGSGFDLAIAAAVLSACGELPPEPLQQWMLIGELSLTGALRPVRGTLAHALCAKAQGFTGLIVPEANAREASVVNGVEVKAANSLREVTDFLSGRLDLASISHLSWSEHHDPSVTDFSEICGQDSARRALELSAAGGHNVLFVGPPGGGKTLLARAMPGILPRMTFQESIETTLIHSIAGMVPPGGSLLSRRPFRAPHHTASAVGLVGGSDPPRPGEVTLAHNGVLFLDELPEFPREALECLREPIEEGTVSIVRARARTTFPARFTLIAAMNPCPCGYHGDPSDRCDCSDERVRKYRSRISGPLLDRIDLQVTLPPVRIADLANQQASTSSEEIRSRVTLAKERQLERPANAGLVNAHLTARSLKEVAALSAESRALWTSASERFGLSARAATRVLRVARTIADLDGAVALSPRHLAEALGFRTREPSR